MNVKSFLITLTIPLCLLSCKERPQSGLAESCFAGIESPDGRIRFSLSKEAGRLPQYSISFDGNPLVKDASLGLQFSDWTFGPDALCAGPEYRSDVENYDLVAGKASHIEEAFNEVRVPFVQEGRRVDLVVRAFNSGLGFRYEFPPQKGWKRYCLTDELTTFDIAGNPKVLTMYLGSYTTSHEGFYYLSDYTGLAENELMEMPTLFCFSDNAYMAVTEAAVRDFAGSYLSYSGGHLVDKLSPLPGQTEQKVKAVLPHRTPWRTFIIGDRPGALIESNLLTNLNDPCTVENTDWIHPGKTTFTWWNGNIVPDSTFMAGNNFMTNKYYIDFVADAGLQYHSIYGYAEQPWYFDPAMDFSNPDPSADVTKPIRTLDMDYIGKYAASKGVGLHLWVNWRPFYNQIDQALPLFESWGVKGMMVDFMDRDDQEMIRIQEEILRKCAAHGIFIQFHGACKPSGLNRTYPNEFTREGTRNYECFKWSKDMGPDLDIAIPFTRLLAGATDYHLGGFRAVNSDDFEIRYQRPLVMCTRTHMLGMYVVLESYLGMVCDYPEAYLGQPGFEFIREVPCTWDETKVPAAEVMKYVCVARRSGSDWWMGAINNSEKRSISVPLDFLEEGVEYEAVLFCDAPDSFETPNHLQKKYIKVRRGSTLRLDMVSGGGAAVHFKPLA